MGKKPLPHDDIVREMREHVATATSLARRTISDDMDQWYVGRGEDSPMERQCDWVSEHLRAAEEIGKKLLGIGEPAAAAVAKGLRANSSGSNAYPEDFGEFLDAVCRLIGGREFR